MILPNRLNCKVDLVDANIKTLYLFVFVYNLIIHQTDVHFLFENQYSGKTI